MTASGAKRSNSGKNSKKEGDKGEPDACHAGERKPQWAVCFSLRPQARAVREQETPSPPNLPKGKGGGYCFAKRQGPRYKSRLARCQDRMS